MKDAYYFQHDANARHDPKLLMLRKEHGLAGIGRWWILVEILREQEDYHFDISPKHNLRALKHELDFEAEEDVKKFLDDLNEFCLLVQMDGIIFSPSLIRRMKKLDAVREKNRLGGIKSGETRRNKNTELTSKTLQSEFKDPSKKSNHLPTYSPTHSVDESTHKVDSSTERNAPERNAPFDDRNLLIPDTEILYTYPATFAAIPLGTYFVPHYDSDTDERKVFIKYNEEQCLSAKEKKYYTVKEPSHRVFTSHNYGTVH